MINFEIGEMVTWDGNGKIVVGIYKLTDSKGIAEVNTISVDGRNFRQKVFVQHSKLEKHIQ